MRAVHKGLFLVLFLMLAMSWMGESPARAAEVADGISIDAHLRTRYDRHDGHDGDIDNVPMEVIENRVRLSLDLDLVEEVRLFVQLQDVRIFGEETHTLFDYSAGGLDMHQAYGDLRLFDQQFVARIGRQEIAWDGQRHIGSVGWTAQARSFDAIRLTVKPTDSGFTIDSFFAVLSDTDNLFALAPHNENSADGYLASLYASLTPVETKHGSLFFSLSGFFDRSRDTSIETPLDLKRSTLGLYHKGRIDLFSWRIEGHYQLGSRGPTDISAFMIGARAGVNLKLLKGLSIVAWFDYLSGDDEPGDDTDKSFDVPYGTNHKFYGFADFFLILPAHTGGLGLMDAALKLELKTCPCLALKLHYHHFMSAVDRGGHTTFGDEIDFVTVYKPFDHFSAMLGLFVMFPDELLGSGDPDVGVYLATQFDL
jgi:hypothetical protein